MNDSGFLSHCKNRQVMISWPVFNTSWLQIVCTTMMRTHQLIIEKNRILHRLSSIVLVQWILICTLSSNCIQFALISNNQYHIISSILILNLNWVELIFLDILTFTNLNFNNFFHLFFCFICFFNLLSEGFGVHLINHEIFFSMENSKGSDCQAQKRIRAWLKFTVVFSKDCLYRLREGFFKEVAIHLMERFCCSKKIV